MKIKLVDEREFETSSFAEAHGVLFISFPNSVLDFGEAFTVFSKKKNTSRIEFSFDEFAPVRIYEGYTNLVSIQKDYRDEDSDIKIILKKES